MQIENYMTVEHMDYMRWERQRMEAEDRAGQSFRSPPRSSKKRKYLKLSPPKLSHPNALSVRQEAELEALLE